MTNFFQMVHTGFDDNSIDNFVIGYRSILGYNFTPLALLKSFLKMTNSILIT